METLTTQEMKTNELRSKRSYELTVSEGLCIVEQSAVNASFSFNFALNKLQAFLWLKFIYDTEVL